jgi:hypothetical protein
MRTSAGEDKKDITVVANDPHAPQGALKHIGESRISSNVQNRRK